MIRPMLSQRTQAALAQNIRDYMKVRGLNQTKLAERCGVPQPRIAEILSGRYDPRVGTIERVARALGVPLASLFMAAEPARSAG